MALRVCIAGAGIGGLALAALLARDGHDVVLLERSPTLPDEGTGIVLAPNAMGVLAALGLDARVQRDGFLPDAMTVADRRGAVLARLDTTHLEHRFGGVVAVHRRVLHSALRDVAPAPRLGAAVAAARPHGDGVRVALATGEELDCDVLVGADGVGSAVRTAVFGDVPLRYAGYTCWRFVVAHALPIRATVEHWGAGRRFGIVPIEQTLAYCFAVENAPPGGRDATSAAGVAHLRAHFAGFGGDVPALLAALPADGPVRRDDIVDSAEQHLARGRVALLGDAAHPLTPNLGQGAGMALEDALVLSRCLLAGGDPTLALQAYAEQRAPRVRWVRDQSRGVGRIAQLGLPAACWVRDRVVRATPAAWASRSFVRLVHEAPS